MPAQGCENCAHCCGSSAHFCVGFFKYLIEYKRRSRNLRVKTLDDTTKTIAIEDSLVVQQLVVVVCEKFGSSLRARAHQLTGDVADRPELIRSIACVRAFRDTAPGRVLADDREIGIVTQGR